ncbi:hypothetical protein TNCV_1915361 [Trichonephila clavipes]|uniref:Uncharacterized protein n=1 Tax=Trichonephila clavipes TaxID=2585209 RepID=A0A8X7BBA0_TRICX|nr:hypothetical protein TNCV_1915361 [Trichonephila clavipes]
MIGDKDLEMRSGAPAPSIQHLLFYLAMKESDHGFNELPQILLKMDKWLKRRKFNDDNSDNDNVRDQVNEHK